MKLTVTFITPPSPFLLDERVFVSLGILHVAAAAIEDGYNVEHLDLNGVTNYEDVVLSHCFKTTSSIFAMTATTPQMVSATKIRNAIRYSRPEAKIIIGGPHPTLVHAAMKTKASERSANALKQLLSSYDVVVCGDGERAILQALRHDSPSLIDADDPKSALFLSSSDTGYAPFPARHLVDLETYHYKIDGVRVTPIVGQRGCPYGCHFCAGRDSAMLRRVRLRSTNSIISEMRHIYMDYGLYGFMFFDDELNVNRQVLDLLKAIDGLQQELGVGFRCRGFIKSELFTEEQAEWMFRAGFRRIMCGFESGNERILKNIHKMATKDDNTRAMAISHKYGLDMKALMSVGHPGESPDTIQDTLDWLLDVRPADFDVTIITAYPGSPYYDRAVPVDRPGNVWRFEVNGDNLYMYDIDYTQIEDFYKGSLDAYKSYVFTDELSDNELIWLRDKVERDVRRKLNIPFYAAGSGISYEASMGALPGFIYRKANES